MSRTQLARRADPPVKYIPRYVVTLRPVEIVMRAVRHVMTWRRGMRILLSLYGGFGLIFLTIAKFAF